MPDQMLAITLAGLSERLQELHRQTALTPLFNPVFQLSHELSRGLESGELTLEGLSGLVDELVDRSLGARAARLRRLLEPETHRARLTALAGDPDGDFEAFRPSPDRAPPTVQMTPRQATEAPDRY